MFKWLFGDDDVSDNIEKEVTDKPAENVDPIVEQRRKEKFSEPLIYSEEDVTKEPEEKPAPQKEKAKAKPSASTKKTYTNKFDNTSDYKLVDIISPMSGLVDAASSGDDGMAPVTKKKRYRPKKDELVPVLSPFYGMGDLDETEETTEQEEEVKESVEEAVEEVVVEEAPKPKKRRTSRKKREKVVLEAPDDEDKPVDSAKVIGSVEDRLRNIATISEQTQDDLKIIEERTGKFKLNRKKDDSLIDEIDDNMSLDELMNLYEKKFKD